MSFNFFYNFVIFTHFFQIHTRDWTRTRETVCTVIVYNWPVLQNLDPYSDISDLWPSLNIRTLPFFFNQKLINHLIVQSFLRSSRLPEYVHTINSSGFLKHHCKLNGAEGIHDFGDLCKYGHVRQAKWGEPGQAPVPPPHPWNKQTWQPSYVINAGNDLPFSDITEVPKLRTPLRVQ